MISSLHGKVEAIGPDWAVINVGGIGFQVHMPTSTLSTLGAAGTQVKVYTHLHVREDNLSLYGFATPADLALFETLLSVSGVGPRIALALLSSLSADKLSMAIATGSEDLLTTTPGIGKKTASRIILELKDKIGAVWISTPASEAVRENADVLAALTSLGYSLSEATQAVGTLPANSKLGLEEKIKLALQYFGGK